jgi:uncharacterized protein
VLSYADSALLLGVGALGGAVGSAGGITSLISYPALLAVGLTPLTANVTQAVAFVASLPGSALGSRPELRGRASWIVRWLPLIALGSAGGDALLLSFPAGTFARVVPYLLVVASCAMLLQPWITAWHQRSLSHARRLLLPCGVFAVALYNGYFGAGAGVMALALLLVTADQHVARANALKNVLLGAADVVAALGFVVFGPVHWTAAAPLALGLLVGSRVGPSLTRRVPGNVVRVLVALAGLGLAIRLWVVPG